MFKKIIVGLDGSDHATHALDIACDLAGKYDSEICLVHTPQPESAAMTMGAMGELGAVSAVPSDAEVFEAATRIVAEARKKVVDAKLQVPEIHMETGDPADQIVSAADTLGADLIVTGRRGLGAVGSLVLGSTSQKIARNASCACLTVE